jgi:hypothetical protein
MTGMSRGDQGPIEEWNRLTAGKTQGAWARPAGGEFKFLWTPKGFAESLNGYYGDDAFGLWKAGGNTLNGFWRQDNDGSMSAVSRFLYRLGVRFYMPIELGEVVPQLATIPLPEINETFTPDFPCRYWAYYNYFNFPLEQTLWDRRLGMNEGAGYYSGVHGLTAVHSTEQTKKAHPEFYALVGGVRDTESRGVGTPCFNSEELFRETVNYCRFRFDVMGDKVVDIMPGDGLKACQSEQCIGKTNSELVWGFVNRVAKELYKTHPDKLVNCGAYTSYRDAPDTIQKFSPNVMVSIYNYGRATFNDRDKWDYYRAIIEKWESKLAPGRIRRGENNLHNGSPSEARRKLIGYPIIFPRAMSKDLVYLKGKSLGEGAEAPQIPGSWKAPGVDHLALYLQASFLMDADQDVDQVLDEYFRLFYGPAAAEMKEAFDYAENNIATKDTSKGGGRSNPTNVPVEVNLRLRELFEKARVKAGETIYGERIDKIISELKPAEEVLADAEAKRLILAARAMNAPLAIAVRGADLSKAQAYPLVIARGEASGKPAKFPTTFRAGWDQGNLLLEITCAEPDMANVANADPVYNGDYIAVGLDTPLHSYYLLHISPDGRILDGDPAPGEWASLTQVETVKGDGVFTMKLRIPIADPEEAQADPNHKVAGEMPSAENPWYLQIGRNRVRGSEAESTAFSPVLPNTLRGKGWSYLPAYGKLQVE